MPRTRCFPPVLALFMSVACTPAPQTESSPDAIPPDDIQNTGLVVGHGTTQPIHRDTLEYQDNTGMPQGVRFTITAPPIGGSLELSGRTLQDGDEFTQADINSGRLAYRHERGDPDAGTITFDVTDEAGNVLPGQSLAISVLPNVSSHGLTISGSTVTLTWTNPAGTEYRETVVRRCTNGDYPVAVTDCTPVYRGTSAGSVSESVDISTTNGPRAYYYATFACGENEVCADGMRAGLYCDLGKCVTVPELRNLNMLRKTSEAAALRTALIREAWGADNLPAGMPTHVGSITDAAYPEAKTIRLLTHEMGVDLRSRMRLYEPFLANRKLIIYHEGHTGNEPRGTEIIRRLLSEGFHVLQVSMLFTGYNWNPEAPYQAHDQLAGLERPMRYFLEPVAVAINYALTAYPFQSIYMMGISGGGWTTVVYSALDTRIAASYPVAGSFPFYLRDQMDDSSAGDFEQINPDFYRYASYIDLYLLGALGRRQLQIYNKIDNCCFVGTWSATFAGHIQRSATALGGSLEAWVDDTATTHSTTDAALERILADIAANTP